MISENGAVLLGKNVACDAFAERKVRIVTHAHSDHMLGLERSLKYGKVYATPATAELIKLFKGKRVSVLDYNERLKIEDEQVELFDAGHIIGSAQVLLIDENGKRWVYTGDFRLDRAEVVKSDLLVIEATYGNPKHVRNFDVEDKFLELIDRFANSASAVHIFGYHGKLQEVAEILRDYTIYMAPSVYRVARICEKYGMKFGDYFLAKQQREGIKIYLTGWEFREPVRKISENEYVVALSDHSDFEGLLKYVELSDPQLVITDNYRVGDALALAREIKRRLGIEAIAMP